MTKPKLAIALCAVMTLALMAAACGQAAQTASDIGLPGAPGLPGNPEAARMSMAAPAQAPAPAMQAAPAPAMAATAVPQAAMGVLAAAAMGEASSDEAADAATVGYGPSDEEIAAFASQRRVIVRTIDMTLIAPDIDKSMQDIAALVDKYGGWVVSSNRSARHSGSVSIRVPASELDAALMDLRAIAQDVRSEVSTSRDFTEEYIDLSSRISSLQKTEEALQGLLDSADSLEHTLGVFQELKQIRSDIEALQGRVRYLETTSAFSLINVTLELEARMMRVSAGEDAAYRIGETARFRAVFTPPEGIDEYRFTWNFGDGAADARGSITAPTLTPGERVTATVTHIYHDDDESPYIVSFDIVGTGEAGIVEGEDTFIASVAETPVIEVFVDAGGSWGAEQGTDIEFIGSFTAPKGVTDLRYEWDFGDGSPNIAGIPQSGETRLIAAHAYDNYRNDPYPVTLTITGDSEVGEVEGKFEVAAFIVEARGLVIQGWDASGTVRDATRVLSGLAQGAGTLLIWLGVLSPVWLIAAAVIFAIVMLTRRHQRRLAADLAAQRADVLLRQPRSAPDAGEALDSGEQAPPAPADADKPKGGE